MTTLNESYVNSLKINRLTKTQLNNATNLSQSELYFEDPEFVGGKLLETTSDGNIVESSQTIPTKTSDLTNDSGFIAGITSSDVTTALGYTPYDASNPNGYTSNTGTVTSVNNVSPVNGDVSLSIPTVNNPTITITQGGVSKGSFTLNQSTGDTIALDAGGGSPLPSQTGHSGEFLTTDGTDASWGVPSSFKLFHHDWFDYQLNDMAWLRADTFSWQDGTVYSNAYNHLVADYNGGTSQTETVGSYTITYYLADDGHKICLPDQETAITNIYNESGVAWYYILDTTNQRFKLPRTKYGFVGLRDAVGKYVPESLPNIKGSTTGIEGTGSGAFASAARGNGAYGQVTYYIGPQSFDASRSSSTYQDNAPVQERATQMYLYFYVGQFSQSATEQTAGLNSEMFNGKADIDMSNVPSNIGSTAKSYFAGIGMPSDNWENVSLPANGGYVIAPANGYYCISGTGQSLYLGIEDANGERTLETWTSNSGTFLPIYKGQKCIVGYSAAPSTFRFVYAQGEV